MHKKVSIILMILIIPLFLTSCFDAIEIGEYAYIAVAGIESGISDMFRITLRIPDANKGKGGGEEGGGGGGGGEKEDKEIFTIEAASFDPATYLSNTNISKTANWQHCEIMVISEELAKKGGLGKFVAPYTRYRQMRRTTYIIICKGKAEEFVKALKPYSGEYITQTIDELFRRSTEIGYFPTTNLNDAHDGIGSSYHSFFAVYAAVNKGENISEEGPEYNGGYKIPGDYYAGDLPRKSGQEVEFVGTALFDGDKMTGKLTGFETQMLLLVRNELTTLPFSIPDPKMPEVITPMMIREFEKPKIKVDVSGDKPKIKAEIRVEGDIEIVQSGFNYEKIENKNILEKAIDKFLEDGIKRTFKKCQESKSDAFGFGVSAVSNFLTIPEWENYKWLSKFPEAEFEVKVEFTIRRTGKMLKTMPIVSSEGEQ